VVVGDHLDFLYGLPGPLAAGTYHIVVNAVSAGGGGTLQAEVADIAIDGGAATVLASASVTLDGGFAQGALIDSTQTVAAFPAACGDILRLRVSMPSGPAGSYYDSIQPVLTIP
jgi:hypothetical protein